jgi:hypothetical protein
VLVVYLLCASCLLYVISLEKERHISYDDSTEDIETRPGPLRVQVSGECYPHPAFTKCPVLANDKSLPVHPPSQDADFNDKCQGYINHAIPNSPAISLSASSKTIKSFY